MTSEMYPNRDEDVMTGKHHKRGLRLGRPQDNAAKQAPETPPRTESEAEFDNWAQDTAAEGLEASEFPEEEARYGPGSTARTSRPEPPRTDVAKYADPAMFTAVPLAEEGQLVEPKVTLVYMTPNPLREIAAAAALYRGNPVTDPATILAHDARAEFDSIAKSRIQAVFEYVDFHFLLEGVSRAFTHQLVRQRVGVVFIQESMRFAVKENAVNEVVMPPSIQDLKDDDPLRVIWQQHVEQTSWVYNSLVNGGIPAEDARGALLINTATRIHYKTNLSALIGQSGNRLCSQAQYEWKQVWREMIRAIINYGPVEERWQQVAIGRQFRPVCYATGKCEFLADTDRYCSIRERVEKHHAAGDPPATWADIDPRETLHVLAARKI